MTRILYQPKFVMYLMTQMMWRYTKLVWNVIDLGAPIKCKVFRKPHMPFMNGKMGISAMLCVRETPWTMITRNTWWLDAHTSFNEISPRQYTKCWSLNTSDSSVNGVLKISASVKQLSYLWAIRMASETVNYPEKGQSILSDDGEVWAL